MNHWLPRSLLAICVGLVLGIGYEIFAPAGAISLPPAKAVEAPSLARLPVVVPPPEDEFAAIEARPIFNPSRQPVNDQTVTGSAIAQSDLELIGVIQAPDTAIAILKSKSTSASMSVKVGDLAEGWRVARITATSVVLRVNGGDFEIPLDNPGSGAAAAMPPVPSPTQGMPVQSQAGPTQAPVPQSQAAAAPQTAVIAVTPPQPAKPLSLPVHSANGSIDPEALKGAPIDPSTGQPTL